MSGASAEDLIGRYQCQCQSETKLIRHYRVARDSEYRSATLPALSHMAGVLTD